MVTNVLIQCSYIFKDTTCGVLFVLNVASVKTKDVTSSFD